MKPIVTLISDWRLRDPYVAMLKGALYSKLPEIEIIDITHQVDFFNLNQTAFLMRHSYDKFPKGSIHLLLTNASVSSQTSPVLVEYDGHFFISEDNGVFCLMFQQYLPKSGRILKETTAPNLLEKIIHLSESVIRGNLNETTEEYKTFRRMFAPIPICFEQEHRIEGEIVYIDGFFNAITNIPCDMFKNAVHEQAFNVSIQSKVEWKCQTYHEAHEEEEAIYLTDSSLGCISITMFQGKVAILADLKVGDKVTITYES